MMRGRLEYVQAASVMKRLSLLLDSGDCAETAN